MVTRRSDANLAAAEILAVTCHRHIHPELNGKPLGEGHLETFGDVLDHHNPNPGTTAEGIQKLVDRSRSTGGRPDGNVAQFTADDGSVIRFERPPLAIHCDRSKVTDRLAQCLPEGCPLFRCLRFWKDRNHSEVV